MEGALALMWLDLPLEPDFPVIMTLQVLLLLFLVMPFPELNPKKRYAETNFFKNCKLDSFCLVHYVLRAEFLFLDCSLIATMPIREVEVLFKTII